MGGGGSPSVINGLAGGQKVIDRLLMRLLTGQDPGPIDPQHPGQGNFPDWSQMLGFGGATPYTVQGPSVPVPPGASGPAAPGGQIPGPINAPLNQLLQNLQAQTAGFNPLQNYQQREQNLAGAIAGNQSRPFVPIKAPDKVNLNPITANTNFNFRPLQAGPALSLGNIQAPSPFQYQNRAAGPSLGQLNFTDNYNYKNQAAGPQVQAQTIRPDLGYKYDPFHAQDISQGLGAATNRYNYTPDKVRSTMDNSQFTQDYFEKGIKAPLLRAYDQAILPRLSDTAAAAGGTFSTRAQVAQQQALGDLQTQMAAQLTGAVRQDEIERAQQNLQAQEFNVGTGTQNAQFGAGQQLAYDQANMQRLLQIAGMNQQGQQFQHVTNTQGLLDEYNQRNQNILAAGQLNNAFNMQAQQINNQDRQFVQGLNAQGQYQDAALNAQLQQAFGGLNTQRDLANLQNRQFYDQMNTQGALNAFQANSANALNFGNLNTQRALGAGQLNNQNNQFFAGLNTQGALDAFNASTQATLGLGNLNTQRALGAGQLNNQAQMGTDQFNQAMMTQLSEAAANRQLQATGLLGDQLNSMWNQYGMMGQLGQSLQGLSQADLNRMFQEFQRMAPENSPWLQQLQSFLGHPNAGVAYTKPAPGDQIAGGLGLGIGGLSGLSMLPTAGATLGGLGAGLGGLASGVGAGLGGLGAGALGLLALL